MVTNSFKKRKFHAANVKAQGALLFSFLSLGVGGGGEKDFISIFPGSQCVPVMFL
jgi:hypothetical protein